MIDEKKLVEDVVKSWKDDRHLRIEGSTVHDQEHYHLMRIIKRQPKVGEWIPCSGCVDCKHKECEHNGKV